MDTEKIKPLPITVPAPPYGSQTPIRQCKINKFRKVIFPEKFKMVSMFDIMFIGIPECPPDRIAELYSNVFGCAFERKSRSQIARIQCDTDPCFQWQSHPIKPMELKEIIKFAMNIVSPTVICEIICSFSNFQNNELSVVALDDISNTYFLSWNNELSQSKFVFINDKFGVRIVINDFRLWMQCWMVPRHEANGFSLHGLKCTISVAIDETTAIYTVHQWERQPIAQTGNCPDCDSSECEIAISINSTINHETFQTCHVHDFDGMVDYRDVDGPQYNVLPVIGSTTKISLQVLSIVYKKKRTLKFNRRYYQVCEFPDGTPGILCLDL